MYCLLKASHKKHQQMVGMQVVVIDPGEFIFGRKKAAAELKMKESTVWKYIKFLEQVGNVDIKSNNKYSIVNVVNWGKYQENNNNEEQQHDNNITTKEQQHILESEYSNSGVTVNEQKVTTKEQLETHKYAGFSGVSTLEERQQNNNNVTTKEQQSNTNKNDKNVKNDKKDSSSSEPATLSDVITFYQNNFGLINPYIQDDLSHWTNDLSAEVVIEAMKRACERQKNYGYAKGTMQNWLKTNVKTMEQVQQSDLQFEKSKQPQKSYSRQKRVKEFPEQLQKQYEERPQQQKIVSDADLEANAERLRAKMANLFGGDGNQTSD